MNLAIISLPVPLSPSIRIVVSKLFASFSTDDTIFFILLLFPKKSFVSISSFTIAVSLSTSAFRLILENAFSTISFN